MDPTVTSRHDLVFRGRRYRCAVGRHGFTAHKREGDEATPIADMRLVRVLYRADRGPAPETSLPTAPIGREDGWCDDFRAVAYNRPVHLPYPARAETLWRDDGLYDIVVVLDWNLDPVVPGMGSAVFLHVAAPLYAPTMGCVALGQDDLRDILRLCAPGTLLRIGPIQAKDQDQG